eukprot:CAMPEP_0116822434 /NCGR_PEP_ID=MMETSP0418-20121206/266_1 /TAXON_ID=1158023 /ORGANISM="Astrosyne radiata, Strain 13vi08-1A" /LENGTH=87 /DNA_ID=CAMNT_0004450547 /DNA_START=442 /DNA_END=705 /DNA_ORIENTATION=-
MQQRLVSSNSGVLAMSDSSCRGVLDQLPNFRKEQDEDSTRSSDSELSTTKKRQSLPSSVELSSLVGMVVHGPGLMKISSTGDTRHRQ